jgi:hypothetical protein
MHKLQSCYRTINFRSIVNYKFLLILQLFYYLNYFNTVEIFIDIFLFIND